MKYFIGIIIGVLLVVTVNTYAFRTASPTVFTDLQDENQLVELNNLLDNLWQITNGRYTTEVRSADPTNIDDGDVWILESGATHQLKWRAGGVTYLVNGT